VPVFSYLLIVGSVLTGLLFFANRVMDPGPSPFSVSQRIGLPEPSIAPVVVVTLNTGHRLVARQLTEMIA